MQKSFVAASALFLMTGFAQGADSAIAQHPVKDNEQIVRSLFEAFNRHDVEALVVLYAPDAYLRSSDLGQARQGEAGVRLTYTELFSQLPAIRDEIKTIVVQGDQAAVEFVSAWEAGPDTPAGRLEFSTFFKLKNGKITSDTTYFTVPLK